MQSKILVEYNPVLGQFVPIVDVTRNALTAARRAVGEDAWKRGFDPSTNQVALKAFAEAGGSSLPIGGNLVCVYYAETKDPSGNIYRKLRLKFESKRAVITVSLECQAEIAQRLIQMLLNVTPGEWLSLASQTERVERNGRVFFNHIPLLERPERRPVGVKAGLWKQAQQAADEAVNALKGVIKNPKLLNEAAATAKVDFHVAVLREQLQPMFAAVGA
jgi:hypothetical protein